jgi:hypothetical protein
MSVEMRERSFAIVRLLTVGMPHAGPAVAAMRVLSEIGRFYANADGWLVRCLGGIGPGVRKIIKPLDTVNLTS